jgi:hypothetical protein
MKLKWREHEFWLANILAIIAIAGYIWPVLTTDNIAARYAGVFREHQLYFNYYRNILLPHLAIVVLIYFSYLCLSRFVVPSLKSLSLNDTTRIFLAKIRIAGVWLILLSFILAYCVNLATYYSRPYYFNYDGFAFLAFFGYNDQPLTNLVFGLERGFGMVLIFTALLCIREAIIYSIENSAKKKLNRIEVNNQVTLFAVIYFSLYFFLSTFGFTRYSIVNDYFIVIPSILLVYLGNIYWLFPSEKIRSGFNYQLIAQLLSLTFACTFLFFIGKPVSAFLICWIIQLFVVAPVSWFVYQRRKDKILGQRGLEKELSKSKADLQFLRSQINPHFLFNSLNTLYGTALREGAEDTASSIQKLGDMMRFMLHENNQDLIPMNKEIDYLKNYLSLQRLRMQSSSNILIEDNIGEQRCQHPIAPMLLIPFVENAFKHGISLQNPSWVKIKLTCNNNNIQFEVRNSMHDSVANDPEKGRSGIGLMNVIERLKLLYYNKHELNYTNNGEEFIVELLIYPGKK